MICPVGRQVGEAVRIRRMWLTLKSKGEFNRCSIPRLTLGLEDDDEDQPGGSGDEDGDGDKDDWTDGMLHQRDEMDRVDRMALGRPEMSTSAKRMGEEPDISSTRRSKRRKYKLLEEDWGVSGEESHNNFLYSGLER